MRAKILNKRTLVLITVILFIFLICYNSQSLTITTEDRTYLELFLERWKISQTPREVHQSFDSEVAFISRVQDSVLAQVGGEQIPHRYFGNVGYYYKTRRGICYDKAALMEKVFSLYQFPSRHVYVYFANDGLKATLLDFFNKHTASHALLEVKTQKGWMMVETNGNWMGLTTNNEVLSTGLFRQKIQEGKVELKKQPIAGSFFWEREKYFRYVYGLYSRHGDFFSQPRDVRDSSLVTSHHLLPDYNITELPCNFWH